MTAAMVELLYFADRDVKKKLFAAAKAARKLTLVAVVPPHRATKNAQRQEPFASIERKFGSLVDQILVVDEGTMEGMWRDPMTDFADALFRDPKEAYQAARGYLFVVKGVPQKVVKRFGDWDDDVWFLHQALAELLPGDVDPPDPKKQPGVKREQPKRVGAFKAKAQPAEASDDPGQTVDLDSDSTLGSSTGRRDAFTALGLEPDATLAEAKAAYKRLVVLYHPDKVAHLAPEFQQLAEKKTRELREAFEAVKAELDEE